jgi:hypothetical protein
VIDIGGCWLDWFGKQSDSVQARLACNFSACIPRAHESVYTVDIDSVYSVTYDGLRGTGVHFHIASSNRFQYRSRIVGRLIKRSIAMDGAHTEQFNVRIVCAEEEGVCVLRWMISNVGVGEATMRDSHHAQYPCSVSTSFGLLQSDTHAVEPDRCLRRSSAHCIGLIIYPFRDRWYR